MKMNDESKIFGMSVRAFIALLICLTLCYMTVSNGKIVEPFYSICLFVIGFFFGQKDNKAQITPTMTTNTGGTNVQA